MAEKGFIKLKIMAVGDMSFGDFPFLPGAGMRTKISVLGDPFVGVKDHLKRADMVFGNLETVLSDSGLISGSLSSYEMRGTDASVECLVAANFTHLNLANNHTMQHGDEAFYHTVQLLEENSINVIGLSDSVKNKHNYSVDNNKICILGVAFEGDSYGNRNIGYCEYNDEIFKKIKKLRSKYSRVIVSCHWGVEFMDYPSPYVVSIAHKLIDSGACLVLGHHSHCLQSVEKYMDGCIFYSLGNFLFDMVWWDKLRYSVIVEIDLGKEIDYKIHPVLINDNGMPELSNISMVEDVVYTALNNNPLKYYTGDFDRDCVNYFHDYSKLLKFNRSVCYRYFLSHYFKLDKSLRLQVITRTLKRKIKIIPSFC